ncbi:MAG TPA: GNAT family protein [Acidobacteriaceae bacterium]|jgi:RimJ/RimL family protein N-acetyltransferase|nr:GNAT family protein [Acidobacteriaceae bacterium]
MRQEKFTLIGKHVRLEPLEPRHIEGLSVVASPEAASLYRWTYVPQGIDQTTQYVNTAITWRDAGIAYPFATVRQTDGVIIGSSRYFDVERWAWPAGHERHGRLLPDVCEIGYTWLGHSSIRTAANTEAKLLMLTHAFEEWQVLRVCLHTDERNERSRVAIERIGGKFEGILRSHRLAADHIPRNSARFSIVASEWPEAKQRLTALLLSR